MQSIKANSVKVMHPHTVLKISVPARHFISDEQEIQVEGKGKKKVHRTLDYLTTQHLNSNRLFTTS